MDEDQVYVGGDEPTADIEPTAEQRAHCAAIADAVRVFARAYAQGHGASPGSVLDGLMSAYVNEAMWMIGPIKLAEAFRIMVGFAEGKARRAAN